MARHGINRAGLALLGPGFPWWTLAVNVAGSFAIGLLAGLFGAWETGHNIRLFLITGVLGGFTTFSAFSLDALTLWERGAFQEAGLYVLGSVILSLMAAAVGLMATRLA
jgi:CrcB protein